MKKNSESKAPLGLHLPQYAINELKRTAALRRTTCSSIVLAMMKGGLGQSESDSIVDKRLNRLQRQYERMHREQRILTETLASLVKVYLAHTPVIPEEQKASAEKRGAERFEKFLGIIERAFAENDSFSEVIKERIFTEEEFEGGEQ